MLISVSDFGGVAPRIEPQALANNMATQAINCKLWHGHLAAYFAPSAVLDGGGAPIELFKKVNGTVRSLFRFDVQPGDADGDGKFFHANGVASYARAPLPGDAQWATLISGDDLLPRLTYRDQQGGPDYPTFWHTLGLPVPDVSGSAAAVEGTALDGSTAANDGVNRNYLIAWVNDRNQLGPTSNPITPPSVWLPGQTVRLTGLPTSPGPGVTPLSKRVYRQSQTTNSYFFVAEIGFADDEFVDNVPEAGLGEAAVNILYEKPPDDISCLGVASNGIAYAASGADVCLSEPSLVHAWNPLVRETLQYDIIAMGHFGSNIVAATGENPYLIYGTQPGRMIQKKLNINQGCLGKRSLVSGVFGVTYASRDGLVLVNGNGNSVVTSSHFTRDEWHYLKPGAFNAALYADRYFAFIEGLDNHAARPEKESIDVALEPLSGQQGGMIFDPRDPERGLVFIDTYGTALYSDPIARGLYFVTEAGEVMQWDNDLDNRIAYQWQSKEFVYPHYIAFQFGRVLAQSYDDVEVDFFVDGVLQYTHRVIDREPFPMICRQKGRVFQFAVRGTDTVTEVSFAGSAMEFSR